jgi:hypothetical protein
MASPAGAGAVLRAKQPKRIVTAISVDFELNTTDGLRRVVFGLEKKPSGTDIEWQIHFKLFERDSRTAEFGDPIVKLDVTVDTALAPAAETLAHSKPTPEQSAEIVGPVADDAKAVKSGDLSKTEFDESAQSVIG